MDFQSIFLKTVLRLLAKIPLLLILQCISSGCQKGGHPSGALVESSLSERTGLKIFVEETLSFHNPCPCYADSLLNKPLNAETAAKVALLLNPSLKTEMMGIGIKGAELQAAMLFPNPSFAFSLFFPDKNALDIGVDAGLSYRIIDLFLMPFRKKSAGEAYRGEEMRVVKEALKLINHVKEAFYLYQEALLQNTLAELSVEASDIKTAIARQLYEEGCIGSELFYGILAEMWESRELMSLRSKMAAERRAALSCLLGVSCDDFSINLDVEEEAIPCSSENIWDFVCSRVDVAIAEREVKRLLALRPTFSPLSYTFASLGIGYEHDPEKYNAVGPSASFDLPLFNTGRSDRIRLDYEIGTAFFQKEMAVIQAVQELKASLKTYEAAKERLVFAGEMASSAEEQFDSAFRLYNVMNIDPLELLEAKKSEIRAKSNKVLARLEAMRESVRFQRALHISLND